jgi:hypothetical protein
MKKFFTLIAVALVAINVSAQDEELVDFIGGFANGKMFNKSSNDDADLMSHFKSTEWIDGAQVGVAQSRVVKDPNDEGMSDRLANWCIQVSSRTAPVNEETGEVESTNPWDSQFFITLPGTELEANKKYVFTMRIKADKPAKGTTQTHTTPGTYKQCPSLISYTPEGESSATSDLNFTTEWQTIKVEATVASNQAGASTIAINLAESKEANNYYFDDIQWSIPVPKVYEWVNIYENDGTDLSTVSVKYFRNYTDEAKSVDGAIVVTSLDPEKDYTGTYYYSDDADTEEQPAVLGRDWDTQFLISLPMPLEAGQKFKFSMKYWADKNANTNTQAHSAAPAPGFIEGANHSGAGTYLWYSLAGDVAFTTEPQTKEWTVTVPDNAAGMQAICFNLDVLREVNNYYFDDIVVYVDKDNVPTAINSFKAEKAAKTIYNVAGQQIKALQKGLNIVNGEKVYVK